MATCHRILSFSFSLLIVIASQSTASSDDPLKAAAPTADSMRGKEAGQVRDDNGLQMKLVWCPPGFVTMDGGQQFSERARSSIPVKAFLTHGCWLGRCEVTQAEWRQVMTGEPWKRRPDTKEGDDYPATWIDWKDATWFCRVLTTLERNAGRLPDGWDYVLPTEAQWERACRARTETAFSSGDDDSKLHEYAWFDANASHLGETFAHRVGRKKPNAWGLHDLHGNVLEWCLDVYAQKLPGGRDPVVVEGETNHHVFRGGGWRDPTLNCRSAFRNGTEATSRADDLGFRVALSSVTAEPETSQQQPARDK